jgi:hypothetical protein
LLLWDNAILLVTPFIIWVQIALGFIIEKKEGSLNVDLDLFKSLLVSICHELHTEPNVQA